MSVAVPNMPGFIEAQANLRTQLGTDVTFKVPVAPTWPGGTKLNPTTGLPYDATVKQTNPAWSEIVKRCLIILKQASPLRPQSDTQTVALGEVSGMDIILDIAESDYAAVEAAKEMVVNGLTYSIREGKPFSLAGSRYRRLIYGEEK